MLTETFKKFIFSLYTLLQNCNEKLLPRGKKIIIKLRK
jgi:hypothetical protein